jgi:hypothetical protein
MDWIEISDWFGSQVFVYVTLLSPVYRTVVR